MLTLLFTDFADRNLRFLKNYFHGFKDRGGNRRPVTQDGFAGDGEKGSAFTKAVEMENEKSLLQELGAKSIKS